MGAVNLNHVVKHFVRLATLVLLVGIGSGCGKKLNEETFDGIACGASDQYRSYMNPMDSTIVQTISIDSAFSTAEVAKIESAVATWNAEGRRSIGRDLFRTQVLGVSARSVPTGTKNCDFPGADGSFSIVRMTDQDTWTALGFSADNPGVTIRCSSGREFASKQVVLINTNNMINRTQIFENVVLHELGHTIGLDHSCDSKNSGIPGFAGCDTPGTDPSYKEAVMFPTVFTNHVRVDLQRNDEERSTCALNYRP